jgi:hypothetical protein
MDAGGMLRGRIPIRPPQAARIEPTIVRGFREAFLK